MTGGAGFIGSHLVDCLVETGHDIIVVDNFSTGKAKNLSRSSGRRNLQVVKADVRKMPRSSVKRLRRIDAVCHLAAATSVQQSVRDPVFTTEVNLVGTLKVLEAAKVLKAQRVVFASSAAVYGKPRAFPISEDASIRPISPYGASKAASELYLGSFAEDHGIDCVSLRYFNVYGPRQTASQYSGVISIFTKRALSQQPLQIFGDGSQTRDFVFVSDVVDATIASLERTHEGGTFNIASGNETTVLELARVIQRITGSLTGVEFLPPRTGDIPRSVADTARAKRELGFEARTSLADGLSTTIGWFAHKKRTKRA